MKHASTLVEYTGPGADAAKTLKVSNNARKINSDGVRVFAASILEGGADQLDALSDHGNEKESQK